jgi:hypothetical protein
MPGARSTSGRQRHQIDRSPLIQVNHKSPKIKLVLSRIDRMGVGEGSHGPRQLADAESRYRDRLRINPI